MRLGSGVLSGPSVQSVYQYKDDKSLFLSIRGAPGTTKGKNSNSLRVYNVNAELGTAQTRASAAGGGRVWITSLLH